MINKCAKEAFLIVCYRIYEKTEKYHVAFVYRTKLIATSISSGMYFSSKVPEATLPAVGFHNFGIHLLQCFRGMCTSIILTLLRLWFYRRMQTQIKVSLIVISNNYISRPRMTKKPLYSCITQIKYIDKEIKL